RELGRAIGAFRYALPAPGPQTGDWAPLAAGAAAARALLMQQPVTVKVGSPAVDVSVTNGGMMMYRRPDPIEPVPLVARWTGANGALVHEERATRYLPAVLPSGSTMVQNVAFPAPTQPGRYTLTLAPAERPDLVIVAQTVDVTP